MVGGSEFVNSVQKLLGVGNTELTVKMFGDEKNIGEVKNNSWDLIPVITQYLTTCHEMTHPELFKCCKQLLNIIVDISNPEEVLLQFIEEIEESVDDTKFIVLLNPLKKILFRIPKKRLNSLAWSLNALQTYLNKCSIPEYDRLVGKEKLLLDNNENVIKITNLYSEVLLFYDVFVEDIEHIMENVQEYVGLINKFLIQLLGKPLACLNMEVFNGVKSKARNIAEKLVMMIFKVNRNPMELLVIREVRNKSDMSLTCPSTLGISVLFYLVYSEEICVEKVVKVYDPIYFFHYSLHLITSLLEVENQMCSEKAVRFGSILLNHIKFIELPYLLLDSEDHSNFCKALCNLIVYNDIEYIRKSALNIYQIYLTSFEIQGFYLLVYNLMSTLNHTGLIGFTITQYKDLLAKEFSKNERNVSVYFKGEKLLTMLRKFCHLHKNEESDLIELSDQIMATLNLLRYLALRDRNNVTQIWDYFRLLDESYFKDLRKGIELSRAHYELKIKEVEEETGSGDKNKSKSNISVMVAGQNLLEMTTEEKLNVLHSSLTAFDIMDSLLSRVIECIELNKH